MDLKQAKKALILLHGRGGTARHILPLAKEFCDDTFYVVAPQAEGNSWYPHSFLTDERQNEPELTKSLETIGHLVEEIAQVIPKEHIYLMGFSQGACLSLEFSSRFAAPYGGIIAFTGGLIGKEIDESKYQGNFKKTKVFIGLSDHDPFVPLIRAEASKNVMEKLGAEVTLKVYPGNDHTIRQDEIAWVKTHIF